MEQTLTGVNGHPLLDGPDTVCHLYDTDPTKALCGLVLDEWDEDDTGPECVVCAALEAAAAE